VVATNLKQRRIYNITMPCRRVLLDKLRHFLNCEKIITARMHVRGNDDVDNKTTDEMTRKWGTVQKEQPLIPEHPGDEDINTSATIISSVEILGPITRS
jgi:hypothetical protein